MSSVLHFLTFGWLVSWYRGLLSSAAADSIETERIVERASMIKERAEVAKQLLALAAALDDLGDDLGTVIRREVKETLGPGLQGNLEHHKEQPAALPAPKKRGRPRKALPETNGEGQ
jgi:hypothetical protein